MTTTLPKRSEVQIEYTWDLSTIYPSDEAWEQDFKRVAAALPALSTFQGRLEESAQTLLEALNLHDSTSEILGRLFVYANLRLHQDTTNTTYQALADRVTTLASELGSATAYMTPEILTIAQERLDTFLEQEPRLRVYRHALDEINRERPHILPSEQEALLAQ